MNNDIASNWLQKHAQTANARDYAAHVALISKNVQLFGVPGFDVIGYEDWASQCEHEFKEGILEQVSYEGLKIVTETTTQIMFKTIETVKGSDGTTNRHGLEIIIEREADGEWRVTQERILSEEETAHDQIA